MRKVLAVVLMTILLIIFSQGLPFNISEFITKYEDRAINFMARQEPPFRVQKDENRPVPEGVEIVVPQIDYDETFKYKKDKYLQLKKQIIAVRDAVMTSIAFSLQRSSEIFYLGKSIENNSAVHYGYGEVTGAFKVASVTLYDMLTTRVVTIDNQPFVVKEEAVWMAETTLPASTGAPKYTVSNKSELKNAPKSVKRVLQWYDAIVAASKTYHVDPALIAAVIEQESGGNPNAISRAGAIGLMQLMPGTAKMMGVDPFQPYENIRGGTKYLAQQIQDFGNVKEALAAYNAGPGNVKNQRYLSFKETTHYVRTVPALREKYVPYFSSVVATR